MVTRNTRPESDAPKDHQDQDDSSLQEHALGDAQDLQDELKERYTRRFPRNFFRYSQDFHDREDGAPGNDQDYGTNSGIRNQEVVIAGRLPEGDGVFESQTDREIREEIMDYLSRDSSLDAADVTVRVEDGVVTLSGSVDESRMRLSIEDSVRSVLGVDEVVNSLVVNRLLS